MDSKKGYIIYLDLLGYKSLIKSKDENKISALKRFISSFSLENVDRSIRLFWGQEYDKSKFLFRSYSDNFLIFYENDRIDDHSLSLCLLFASNWLGRAIVNGFLMRGSIVFGELTYNENVLFGQSIIEAYELESGHNEPSIVLSKELKERYENGGLYKGDLLSPFALFHYDDYENAKAYYSGLKKLVERLNYCSIVDERTLSKYRWIVAEYNRYYQGNCKITFVESPSHYELTYEDNFADI